jgi:hypothetical protein
VISGGKNYNPAPDFRGKSHGNTWTIAGEGGEPSSLERWSGGDARSNGVEIAASGSQGGMNREKMDLSGPEGSIFWPNQPSNWYVVAEGLIFR